MSIFLSDLDKINLNKLKKSNWNHGLFFLFIGFLLAIVLAYFWGLFPLKRFYLLDWRVFPQDNKMFYQDIFLFYFPCLGIALYHLWKAFNFWVDLDNDTKEILESTIIEKNIDDKTIKIAYRKLTIALSSTEFEKAAQCKQVKLHLAYFSRKVLKTEF